MKKIILLILCPIIWQSAETLSAQDSYSLDRCIRTGIENNTDFRRAILEVEIRRSDLASAKMAFLPTFSADLHNTLGFKERLSFSNFSSLTVSGSMTLFKGWSLQHERHAATLELDAVEHFVAGEKAALTIAIIRAYVEVLLAKEELNLAEKEYNISVLEYDKTEILVKEGAESIAALSEIETQLSADRYSMTEAICRIKSRKMELIQLLGLAYSPSFDIEDLPREAISPPSPITASTIEIAASSNPKVLYAVGRADAGKSSVNATIGYFLPEIRLSGSYSANIGKINRKLDSGIGITISIPLFDGGTAISRAKTAKISLKEKRIEVEKARRAVEAEIEGTIIESDNAFERYLAGTESVKSLEKLVELSKIKYDCGASTILEYIMARNKLAKARISTTEAKWQFILNKKILETYLEIGKYKNEN